MLVIQLFKSNTDFTVLLPMLEHHKFSWSRVNSVSNFSLQEIPEFTLPTWKIDLCLRVTLMLHKSY